MLDAYSALIKRGTDVSNTPYQQYGGQQVAGLTDLQNQGIQNIRQSSNIAQPYIGQAAGLANQSAQSVAGNLPQYNQENIQQYEDPYQQQVIQATQANLNQNNAVQQQQLLGKAISSGASPFGGDRAGIAAGELARQQNLSNNQTIAGLQSQGFQNAQNQFNAQQNLQLQAQNSDASRQAQAAYLLGGLGTSAQTAALQGGQAQMQAGTVQQQQAQNELNVPYQQWQQQQAYPFATTQYLANLTEGLGSQSGGTGTTVAPNSSGLSAGLGGAVAGASLAAMFLKDGGKVKDYDSGGLVSAAGWVPQDKLSLGHTIPTPARSESTDSSAGDMRSIGALASQFAPDSSPQDIGTAMPWLNGTGADATGYRPDLGNAMPWLKTSINAKNGGGIGKYANGGDLTENYFITSDSPKLDSTIPQPPQIKENQSNGINPQQMMQMASLAAAAAKRGGTIKYADGGDVSDNFDIASEDIPNLGDTQNDAMEQAYNELDNKPTIDHSGDTTKLMYPHEEDESKRIMDLGLPSPKGEIPTADTSHANVKDKHGNLAIPLLATGLGIMAGHSPNALQNIGQGGLMGLQAYTQQQAAQKKQAQQDILNKKADLQQQYLQQKDKELNIYRQQEIAARNQQLKQQGDYQKQNLDLTKQKLEQGKFQWLSGTGQDENGEQVPGIYRNDIKSGESKFIPGGTLTGKGSTAIAVPPGMSPVIAKEQAKTDAKRAQSYQVNKPIIDNIMSHLDAIEPNLQNFTTGAAGDIRSLGNKALMIGADIPGVQSLIPESTKQKAEKKGTASANIDKETSALALEMAKFQPSPGNRSSVLALKTMLSNKPGVNLPPETNSNRIAGIRSDVMNYDLSEQLAQQYRETSPYKMTDSKLDQLETSLKTMYPTKVIDQKTGKVTFLPENVEKFRAAIPDAVKNPDKYLNGQTPEASPASQPAPPPAQRVAGQIYSTPKGNLKWTGTGWVN